MVDIKDNLLRYPWKVIRCSENPEESLPDLHGAEVEGGYLSQAAAEAAANGRMSALSSAQRYVVKVVGVPAPIPVPPVKQKYTILRVRNVRDGY